MSNAQIWQTRLLRIHQSSRFFWKICRCVLLKASRLFAFFARRRVQEYLQGSKKRYKASVPVISVGNLSVGGTGKTPMVAYLLRKLASKKMVILTRGYKAKNSGKNDEVLLLEREFPQTRCYVGANRVENCQHAEQTGSVDGFILDDGFQHLRLQRNLDIVLIDALMPLTLAHTLPAGFLREPPEALARADIILVSHANQTTPEQIQKMKQWIQQYTSSPICLAGHELQGWRDLAGQEYPIEAFSDQPILACCALGNPESFRKTLEGARVLLKKFFVFPDHYAYTRHDLERIWKHSPKTPLLTTGKDIVKLRPLWKNGETLIVEALLKLTILEGESILEQKIQHSGFVS
ncbi:MAG: tetraacyldisaccharide 4'-kinase [Planctomycetota bacterium]